jgi:hypothetical protein
MAYNYANDYSNYNTKKWNTGIDGQQQQNGWDQNGMNQQTNQQTNQQFGTNQNGQNCGNSQSSQNCGTNQSGQNCGNAIDNQTSQNYSNYQTQSFTDFSGLDSVENNRRSQKYTPPSQT